MLFVGIDWAYRRAAWCAMGRGGEIRDEGFMPADEDGLAKLVLALGAEVSACVEMMSGAVWVRDRLQAAGWQVEVADARKVKAVAPLACKTDKVDARVLAELCRRDLVPAVWVPSFSDRELRERLNRRAHLIRLRTAAKNRVFGALSQWGVRIPLRVLRAGGRDGAARAAGVARGVAPLGGRGAGGHRPARRADRSAGGRVAPARPRRSTGAAADDDPRGRRAPRADDRGRDRRRLEVRHPAQADRLRRPGPKVKQSGQSSRTGALSKAGSRSLRWAAIEAAQCAWRPTNPWNRLYLDVKDRTGKSNPAKSAVARKVLIAAWHVLARNEPFKPSRAERDNQPVPASSHFHLAA